MGSDKTRIGLKIKNKSWFWPGVRSDVQLHCQSFQNGAANAELFKIYFPWHIMQIYSNFVFPGTWRLPIWSHGHWTEVRSDVQLHCQLFKICFPWHMTIAYLVTWSHGHWTEVRSDVQLHCQLFKICFPWHMTIAYLITWSHGHWTEVRSDVQLHCQSFRKGQTVIPGANMKPAMITATYFNARGHVDLIRSFPLSETKPNTY
jgi:hypothetical protein